jgi:hypothetical protein
MKTRLAVFLVLFAAIGGSAFGQQVLTISPSGAVGASIDQNGWRNFKVVLTKNVTSFQFMTVPTPPAQGSVTVIFAENAVGGFTVTFMPWTSPSGLVISVSNPCSVSTSANAITVCQFNFDGTSNTWIGSSAISPSGNNNLTGNNTHSGTETFKYINNVRFADNFAGADPCIQIVAAITDLPSTGGTVNALGFQGGQPCSINPLAGITKPILLLLGAATYSTDVQWTTGVASNVIVRGVGRTSTNIQTSTLFPINTAVVKIGDGSTLIFGTRFENLAINCNGLVLPTGCTDMLAVGVNEQSGGSNLLLRSYLTNGLKIDGTGVTTQHFHFSDLEIGSNSAATGTDGILVNAVGPGGVIEHATINAVGAAVQASGVHITGSGSNGIITLKDIHVENCTDGVFFDTGTRGEVYGLDLNTGTSVLHTNTNSDVTAMNISQVSGVTNTIKNDVVVTSITDLEIPFYAQTRTAFGQQIFLWTGTTSGFGNVIAAGNNARFAVQSATVNGTTNLDLIDSANNGYGLSASANSGNPFMVFRTIAAGIRTTVGTLGASGKGTFNGGLAAGATGTGATQTGTIQNGAGNPITVPSPPTGTTFPVIIASGTAAMTTAGIATVACGTTVTVAATGVLTTDTINISHNAAVTAANGGFLTLNAWPTAGNVNFNYCNPSATNPFTPTAMTINWNVTR